MKVNNMIFSPSKLQKGPSSIHSNTKVIRHDINSPGPLRVNNNKNSAANSILFKNNNGKQMGDNIPTNL